MRKIKWELSIGFPTAMRYGEIEVEDSATDEEIESAIYEEVMNRVDYCWEEE